MTKPLYVLYPGHLYTALLMLMLSSFAYAFTVNHPEGWHWYNLPQKSKPQKANAKLWRRFQQLSATQQLKVLQKATFELRAKAILSGKVADITHYKEAQDMWVNKATQFTVGWEKMLLGHPELNYALQHPSANRLVPIEFQHLHQREQTALDKLNKTNGLLLFYRGNNSEDRLFAKTVKRFVKAYHFSLLPVSVNAKSSLIFSNETRDSSHQHARALGIHYFPALVLVNPTSGQHQVVSYGFKSSNELAERLLHLSEQWQAEF